MINVLRYLLVFVEVICSALLLGVILIQKTRSQGMGMAFGSGMGESLFGAQVGNVLTKATVILAIIFLCNTVALAWIGARVGGRVSVTENVDAEPLPAGQPGIPGGRPAPAPSVPAPDVSGIPATPVPVVEGQPGPVESIPAAGGTPAPVDIPAPAVPEAVTPPVEVPPATPEPAPAP